MNIPARLQPYLFASLACLALVGFAGYDLYRERVRSVQQARDTTLNLARLLEESTRQSLRRVESLLDEAMRQLRVADTEPRSAAADASLQVALQALLPKDGLVRGLVWLGPGGEIRLRAQPAAALAQDIAGDAKDVAGPELLARLRQRSSPESRIDSRTDSRNDSRKDSRNDSDTSYGRLQGAAPSGWRLPVARRLAAADGGFAGALVAVVDPATLQPMLDAIGTGRNGFVSLFLRDGWMVATAPHNQALFARNWFDTPMFQQHLPAAPAGTVQQVVVRDKTERVYSYRALAEYPLVVSVGLSMTDALADWQVRLAWNAVLLGLVSAALLAGAIAMSRAHARREAAEAALAESARRTAAIVDHAADGILTLAADGRVQSANRAGAAMFGYDAGAMLGLDAADLVRDFKRASGADALAWPPRDERVESTGRSRDGHAFPIDIAVTEAERGGAPLRVALIRDITDSKKAQAAVALARDKAEQSERFLRAITDNLPLRIAYVDRELRYGFVNRAHCLRYGLERDAVLGRTREALRGKALSSTLLNFMQQALAGHEQRFQIDEVLGGESRTFETVLVPDITAQGEVLGFYAASTDVTERLVQQRRIELALAERETLLREVYHRVKNNLQVVQSLLSLQRRTLPQGAARSALDESIQRVHAMALVHEKLYQSGTLSAVSLHDYTHDLLRHLGDTAGAQVRGIRLHADIDGVEAALETAVPYGLLVAELVGNCFKHAFPGGRGGEVRVSLQRVAAGVCLRVADDGIGLPAGFDVAAGRSMGLQLASSLATQLGGSLRARHEGGAVFETELTRIS